MLSLTDLVGILDILPIFHGYCAYLGACFIKEVLSLSLFYWLG
ncbi:hypothetical protein TUM4261_42890 [Shewanella sp. c952]|nr:hypothetical protein TUM4261_42890 [Shewanella sp. c952]